MAGLSRIRHCAISGSSWCVSITQCQSHFGQHLRLSSMPERSGQPEMKPVKVVAR